MALIVHQSVQEIPNGSYRLTGWIRTQVEVPPLAAAQSASELSADASPKGVMPATSIALAGGTCFQIVDRNDTSEMVTGISY